MANSNSNGYGTFSNAEEGGDQIIELSPRDPAMPGPSSSSVSRFQFFSRKGGRRGYEELSDECRLIQSDGSASDSDDVASKEQSELVAASQIVKRVQERDSNMQLKRAIIFVIFVFILPLCLLAASIFRYNFVSFLYLIFLLALPFIDSPKYSSLKHNHGLKCVILLSILSGAGMGGQVLLEILVATGVANLETSLAPCSPNEELLRQIGFVSYQYKGVDALDIVRLFLPDFIIFFVSTLLIILIRCTLPSISRSTTHTSLRRGHSPSISSTQQPLGLRRTRQPSTITIPVEREPQQKSNSLTEFGIVLVKFFNLLLIIACASTAPSILTSPYILLTLLMGTLWAFRRPIDPGETVSLKFVTFIYLIGHMAVLYLYQFPFVRQAVPPEDFSSRLFGLLPVTSINCVEPPTRLYLRADLGFPEIALPIFLCVTYFYLAARHRISLYYQRKMQVQQSRANTRRISQTPTHLSSSDVVTTSADIRNRSGVSRVQQRVPSTLPEENEETMRLLTSDNQAVTNSVPTTGSVEASQRSDPSNENGSGSPAARTFSNLLPFIPDAATKIFRRGESILLPPVSPPPQTQLRLSPLDTIYSLFSAYAYVFSLLSMMIWSVTHFSILTFVLLVGACILWMVPNSRRACVIVSPLIVLYAKMLIVIEFIYGINLTDQELKSYKEIGLVRYGVTHPGMLAAELLYLFPFWLLLRQRIDKYLAKGDLNMPIATSAETANAVTKAIRMLLVTTAISEKKVLGSQVELNRFVLKLITFLLDQLAVYWIFLCFVVVLIQACIGTTTIIKFFYMLIFLSTSFFFILSFRLWRRLLFTTCWVLCIYSMIVLLSIYIYQFEAVEKWLDVNATTHLWGDLGLNKYDTAPELFQALILPALSLMVIVLQLQFFHDKLLRMTECVVRRPSLYPNGDPESEDDASRDSLTGGLKDEPLIEADWWRKLSAVFSVILQYIWRFLEVHVLKVVVIFSACLAIIDASAVNLPMFFAVVTLLPLVARYNQKGPVIVSIVTYLGVCFAVIFKMGYQLNMVREFADTYKNCTNSNGNSSHSVTQSLDEWLGLATSNDMLVYLQLYIILIILFLVEKIVYVRQDVFYKTVHVERPPLGVVFPKISRADADKSLADLFMFFVNYGFYKFGLEITWLSTMIVLATRLDAYSLVYAMPLVVQLWLPRKTCARFYPCYLMFLVILLLAQYAGCVGFPFYFTCGTYPWEDMDKQLRLWLVLPISTQPSGIDCVKLIGDFVQLLMATCQMTMFRIEAQYGSRYAGGDNSDALPDIGDYYTNPVHDFISEKKSLLDELKAVVFELMFWVTILVLFGAGVSEVNVFSLIYLIVCFILLWYGQSLLIKPIAQLIKTWHIILALNLFVIIVKAGLQLLACMDTSASFLGGGSSSCNIRTVFDLVCVSPSLKHTAPELNCGIIPSQSPLASDIAAFVFLLIMKRLYRSYYFQHVVRDFDIQSSLSSSGAKLILHRQQEQLKREREAERRRVDKIRKKIERIRQRQSLHRAQAREKALGISIDPNDQPDYTGEPDHYKVIRGGDYIMFDDQDSDEEDPAALLGGPRGMNQTAALKIEKTPIDVITDTVMKNKQTTQAPSVSQLPRLTSVVSPAVGGTPEASVHPPVDGEEQQCTGDQAVVQPGSAPDLSASEGLRQRRFHSASTSSGGGVGQGVAGLSTTAPAAVPGSEVDEISEAPESCDDVTDAQQQLQFEAGEEDMQDADFLVPSSTWRDNVKKAARFLYDLVYSSLTSLINLLTSLTFEHYLVRRRLKRQIEVQKDRVRRQGLVPGEVTRARTHGHRKQGSTASNISVSGALVTGGALPSLTVPAVSGATGASISRQTALADLALLASYTPEDLTEEEEIKERQDIEDELRNHSLAYRLTRAVFDLFLSKTEYVCYFLMMLTFLLEGTILSLPLPLLAFSWGMLAIPAPGHRFWITVMTYEMLVVVVKFIFQFPLGLGADDIQAEQDAEQLPWNSYDEISKLFGVDKRSNFALLDILLLVSLFLHRFMLKRYGLWKPAENEEQLQALTATSSTGMPPKRRHSHSDPCLPRMAAGPSGSVRKPKPNKPPPPQISITAADPTEQSMFDSSGEASDVEFIDADIEYDAVLDSSDDMGCCGTLCQRIRNVPSLVVQFFSQLTNSDDRSPRDLYAFIFAADFCALLTTVFAYDKFGPSDQKAQAVLDLLQSDAVPIPFVVLLLVQFSFLLIDRALYIRKLAVGKLIFQIFILLLVHIVTLFVFPLPSVTNIPFSQNAAVQVWYFFKCAYFGFSAYQIKFGYPQHVSTHFLTRQYNYLMWVLLKGFMVIPFLLELRTIMDWVFTRTTLSFRFWLITDLCYYEIFSIKCERRMEEKYPTPRGIPRTWLYKSYGLLLLAGIVFILWFPFLLFSFGDLMVMPAAMETLQLNVRLSGTSNQPIFAYRVDTKTGGLYRITESRYEKLAMCFKYQNQQLPYTSSDIWVAKIGNNSQSLWTLSPPGYQNLIMSLQNESLKNMSVTANFLVTRQLPKRNAPVLPEQSNEVILTESSRKALLKILEQEIGVSVGKNRSSPVVFSSLIAQYLLVDRNNAMSDFQIPNCQSSSQFFNASMSLMVNRKFDEWWWAMSLNRNKPRCDCVDLKLQSGNETEILVVSAPVKAEVLSLLDRLGTSIIGVYSAVVLVVHRLLRSSLIEGAHYRVMFTELPRCDRVWRLLNEIYIVRQFGEWQLEEELVARLIFIYRSPQTMIDQTRQIGLM